MHPHHWLVNFTFTLTCAPNDNKTDFRQIDEEVIDAVNRGMTDLKKRNENEYVLFLADGEYKEYLDKPNIIIPPYVISDTQELETESSRLEFLSMFLNAFYSFRENDEVENDNFRFHIKRSSIPTFGSLSRF